MQFFDTGCPVFKRALFKALGIRDCFVRIDRLFVSEHLVSSKKKLLPSKGNLRSQVSWLPSSSAVLKNSSEARSALADYQEKNDIGPTVGRKNVLKQRAQFMLGNRSNDGQLNDTDGMKNHISEWQTKFTSPNFGLKSSDDHLLRLKQQQPLTCFQKLLDGFKRRVESKSTKI